MKINNKIDKKFIVIMVIIAVLLLIVSIFGYYIKKNDTTSYDIFNKTINNFYKIINNQIDVDSNSVEGNIVLESNSVPYNEYRNLLNTIGGNNANVDFKINYENKSVMLDMDTNFYGNDPINIKKYYDGTYEYTYIENYYDNKYVRKYLFADEYNSLINSIRVSKDYVNILNGLKNAFLCEENSEYFYWTEQKIKVNNKNYNSYSNFFILNEKSYVDIFKNINNALKEDKKFLKSYKNVFNKNFDIKDYNDFVNWFKNNGLSINIYSDVLTNDFLKLYIMVSNNDDSIKSTSLELYPYNDEYKFQILRNVYTVNGIIKLGKNNGEIEVNIPDDNSNILNMKLRYNIAYKNNIVIDSVDDYVDHYSVLDKVGAVYQAMIDRREIANANELYHWYLYKKQ